MNQYSTESQGREGSTLQASQHLSQTPSASLRVLLLLAVVGGLVGGIVGHRLFGIIPRPEMSAKYYKESEERWATLDFSPDVVAELALKNKIKLELNSALVLGVVGAIFGGLFGLSTGIARKVWSAVAVGTFGGALSGGVFGGIAGYAAVQTATFLKQFQVEASRPSEMADAWLRQMYSAIGVHSTAWCLVGLGVGLAVALATAPPRGTVRKMTFGGLAGLLAAVVYMPLASVVFPNENSNEPFPSGLLNRVTFVTLAGIAFAILLHASTNRRKSSSPAPSAEGAESPAAGDSADPPANEGAKKPEVKKD